jgi:endoribonuclease Dicer
VTVLTLDRPECLDRASQPLALLTRSPIPALPAFLLHFGAGRNSPIQATTLALPVNVDASLLHQINAFTLCIFNDVFSKDYEPDVANMPYFLAPASSHSSIDITSDPFEVISWEILRAVEEYQTEIGETPWESKLWQNAPDEFFKDKFIVDPWDGSRKLWSVGVDHRFKPLDPVPPNSAPRKERRKNNDNIMEYSCSLWAKARARRTFDVNQRVVEARYISLRRNLLDEFDTEESESPKQCWVILEPLKISPVSSAPSL